MKRLNGEPVVQFMQIVQFDIPLSDAETILTKSTKADQFSALRKWVCEHHCGDPLMFEGVYDSAWTVFYTAYGKALAEKREKELRMLSAPPPEIHPADIENV